MRLRRRSRAGGGRAGKGRRAGGTGVEEKKCVPRGWSCVPVRSAEDEGAYQGLRRGSGSRARRPQDRSKRRGRGRSPRGVYVSTVRVALSLRALGRAVAQRRRGLLQQTEGRFVALLDCLPLPPAHPGTIPSRVYAVDFLTEGGRQVDMASRVA